MKIGDVQRKSFTRGIEFFDIQALKKYIELPCYAACLEFWEKGIRTLYSKASLSVGSLEGQKAVIGIDYESLDFENARNAELLFETFREGKLPVNVDIVKYNKDQRVLEFSLPITEEMEVAEVSEMFCKMARKFQYQDILYGRESYIFEKFREETLDSYEIMDPELREKVVLSREDILARIRPNWFFDGEDTIWRHESLYNRHLKYINRASLGDNVIRVKKSKRRTRAMSKKFKN